MITLNVNMFVEPDVPVVPLYILDYQSYNNTVPSAALQLNTTPRGSITNGNLYNVYQFYYYNEPDEIYESTVAHYSFSLI